MGDHWEDNSDNSGDQGDNDDSEDQGDSKDSGDQGDSDDYGDQSLWGFDTGDIERVKAAIDNGADVNEEDEDGETKLMLALYYHHHDVVQLLLNHPQIDINKVNRYGECALHCTMCCLGSTIALYPK